jgi:large subunit ribosomal protein L21
MVRAEVLGHGRGRKILIGKYKRRKDYRRRRGHRTNYTELRVKQITGPQA